MKSKKSVFEALATFAGSNQILTTCLTKSIRCCHVTDISKKLDTRPQKWTTPLELVSVANPFLEPGSDCALMFAVQTEVLKDMCHW